MFDNYGSFGFTLGKFSTILISLPNVGSQKRILTNDHEREKKKLCCIINNNNNIIIKNNNSTLVYIPRTGDTNKDEG